ncbi:MAG: HK97-gp10 family putative phage morphogenesis protein [Candidatus Kapaibacteriota bacterium]
MNIEVDDSKVLKALQDIAKKYPEAAKQGLLNTAMEIQLKAKQNCPVNTGRLRSSIAIATKDTILHEAQSSEDVISQPEKDLEVWIGTKTYYAIFVEFGTRKMPAKPYLRPAFLEGSKHLVENVLREIRRGK